eukprot:105795-Amphidinium_carterae.2
MSTIIVLVDGGAIGTMFMVFNIAVTSTVLEPLQCQDHPNDMWTIRNYPSIICWESSDHSTMLFVGTVAFFLVPMNYLVACVMILARSLYYTNTANNSEGEQSTPSNSPTNDVKQQFKNRRAQT